MKNGTKYDGDKARWDLLDMAGVADEVAVLTHGAAKYAPNNWQKVSDPRERYYAALMRHLAAWRGGEMNDPDSGLPHLAHISCNVRFLQYFERKKR